MLIVVVVVVVGVAIATVTTVVGIVVDVVVVNHFNLDLTFATTKNPCSACLAQRHYVWQQVACVSKHQKKTLKTSTEDKRTPFKKTSLDTEKIRTEERVGGHSSTSRTNY